MKSKAMETRLVVCLLLFLTLCVDLGFEFGQNKDSEFTFLLPAGATECFFQTTSKNGNIEVEYQVIAGAGLDVGFTLISPGGYRLVSDFRKSDGIHTVDPTEEGDYRICFDNSFSRVSEKMVYMEVIVDGPEEETEDEDDWAALAEPEDSLEYKLEDIRVHQSNISSFIAKTQWMLCTRTWSEAVSCRRRCGRSRLATATCWRITCGGFPSGPASVCWSWSAWPSHRSTRYADYSVTNTESAHSRDELGEDAVTLYALTVNVKYKLMEVRKLSGKKKKPSSLCRV
ncbi:transmembrane emp24 domain-containing protein 1a isoform X1 [Megalobrama amblycephala]|uniref:transmembrane emp24 domain-containing protein 1a isoform X1 n=1 Tax=Megalobrama amblycephala TaxID=75352 RepID=UPI002013C540|nr:transmembrane emp24 domain-containing protein 1a isoform X1 [Megalobrama amblycephala]